MLYWESVIICPLESVLVVAHVLTEERERLFEFENLVGIGARITFCLELSESFFFGAGRLAADEVFLMSGWRFAGGAPPSIRCMARFGIFGEPEISLFWFYGR